MSDALESIKIKMCERVRLEVDAIPIAKMLPDPVRAQIVPLCLTGLDIAQHNGMLPKKRPPTQRRGHD